MAKKKGKTESLVNIKAPLFEGPKILIQGLKSSIDGFQSTKVIQTWVLENEVLKLDVVDTNGKSMYNGKIKWIGNVQGSSKGCVICVDSGKDFRMIIPTEDTMSDAELDLEKNAIRITAIERAKCSVCGKGLRIFDETASCVHCGAKAHADHLQEWVKMRSSCPICKKALALSPQNEILMGDE